MNEERAPNDRGKALIRTTGGWGVQNLARELLIASSRRDDAFRAKVGIPDKFRVETNSNGLLFGREKNSSMKITPSAHE